MRRSGNGTRVRVAGLLLAGLLVWVTVPQAQRPQTVEEADRSFAVDVGLLLDVTRSADETPIRTEIVPGRVILRRIGRRDFEVLQIDASRDPAKVAAELAARQDVAFAQPAFRLHPRGIPNDPLFARQWNLANIQMPEAWDLHRGTTGAVTVAVLDTGIAYANVTMDYTASAFGHDGVLHPALGPVVLPFARAPELGRRDRFIAPRDFIWNNERPLDLDGHGTHMAGTIGQVTNNHRGPAGIAPGVSLMPLKVLSGVWDDAFGSPGIGTDDTVAGGIRYAVEHGASVINMSIGRTGPASPVIEEAMRYAVAQGAFIVVAAGNGHEAGDPVEVLAEIASRLDGAIAVGATDRARHRAYYSTVGPHVELAAPGGSLRADDPSGGTAGGIVQQTYDLNVVETYSLTSRAFAAPRFDVMAYLSFAGTSSAAAHVSGVAAMLVQRGLEDPAAIEALLKRTAVDRGLPGRDDEFGFGELDARAALRAQR